MSAHSRPPEIIYGRKAAVTVGEDGDLLIEGLCANFKGIDRQQENFTKGAFRDGIKSFLAGPAALCWHHQTGKVLGKVLDLKEVPGGLWLKARVDGAVRTHPELATIYNQIKKGTLTGLSVGGFFKRVTTKAGRFISGADITEISVTGVPVHAHTTFAVVGGKALPDAIDTLDLLEVKLAVISCRLAAATR
jgi:HK97 family phage prohead protease